MKNAGAFGKTTVFLITDTQIKEESFLEDIDNLLNTGEVPNLYAVDEKQEIMEVSCDTIKLNKSEISVRRNRPKQTNRGEIFGTGIVLHNHISIK